MAFFNGSLNAKKQKKKYSFLLRFWGCTFRFTGLQRSLKASDRVSSRRRACSHRTPRPWPRGPAAAPRLAPVRPRARLGAPSPASARSGGGPRDARSGRRRRPNDPPTYARPLRVAPGEWLPGTTRVERMGKRKKYFFVTQMDVEGPLRPFYFFVAWVEAALACPLFSPSQSHAVASRRYSSAPAQTAKYQRTRPIVVVSCVSSAPVGLACDAGRAGWFVPRRLS